MTKANKIFTTELFKLLNEKGEITPIPGIDAKLYVACTRLGKIYSLTSEKWLGLGSVGVGGKGYILVSLKDNEGKKVKIYEHEAILSSRLGIEKKLWRNVKERYFLYTEPMEIDHLDGDVKNNCISNLELVTSAENKRRIKARKVAKRLSQEDKYDIVDAYLEWETGKMDFYKSMGQELGCDFRTVQNVVIAFNKDVDGIEIDGEQTL